MPQNYSAKYSEKHWEKLCQLGQAVIEIETAAIAALANRIDLNFAKACQFMLDCTARVVVLGMGKSGHIAGKIAATLASTGTPAFFVHPGEASHGDMGMITKHDVVLALSNSGETPEIITILPLIKRLGLPFIALTGNENSTIAKAADVNLNVGVEKEACPLGLAPTSSSTASLVMGDALAIALLEAKGFTVDDFALAHPGGSLGKKLLLKVSHLMRTGNKIPQVSPAASLTDALMEMTGKGLGMTTVLDEKKHLIGIYTDGDLRRTLDQGHDIRNSLIHDVMIKNCKTINEDMLAAKALNLMETYKITSLVVVDPNNVLLGVLHLHDVLSAGV